MINLSLKSFISLALTYKDRVDLSYVDAPELSSIVAQLDHYTKAEKMTGARTFHLQILEADPKEGRKERLYILWRWADWESSMLKISIDKARSEVRVAHHNAKKELRDKLTQRVREQLGKNVEQVMVDMMVSNIVDKKNVGLALLYGFVVEELELLFKEEPK